MFAGPKLCYKKKYTKRAKSYLLPGFSEGGFTSEF